MDADKEKRVLLRKAIQLYMAGYDFEVIARELGFEDVEELKAGVFKFLEERTETPEFMMKLNNQRYEEIIKGYWPFMKDDANTDRQVKATRLILQVLRMQAKLLNLEKVPEEKDRITLVWDVPVRMNFDEYEKKYLKKDKSSADNQKY
jgi:hypothetical protein